MNYVRLLVISKKRNTDDTDDDDDENNNDAKEKIILERFKILKNYFETKQQNTDEGVWFFNRKNDFEICKTASTNKFSSFTGFLKNVDFNEFNKLYLIYYNDFKFCSSNEHRSFFSTYKYLEYVVPNNLDNDSLYTINALLNDDGMKNKCRILAIHNKFAYCVKSLLHISFYIDDNWDGGENKIYTLLYDLTSVVPFLIRKIEAWIFEKT